MENSTSYRFVKRAIGDEPSLIVFFIICPCFSLLASTLAVHFYEIRLAVNECE